jgi:arylsulfatase A
VPLRLVRALTAAALLTVVGATTPAAPPPNLIVILADDMGVGDVSSLNPASRWKTPGIDRLAREGRIFTDAHSASGVCTPSRYALLTGRYPWHGRLKRGVLYGHDAPLIESGRLTLPGLLQKSGYVTAMIGKWHLGLDWVRTGPGPQDLDYSRPFGGGPLAHGFDSFFGIAASLDMPPYVYLVDDGVAQAPSGTIAASPRPAMWRAGPISADFSHEDVQPQFARRSLEFIERRAAAADRRPFFLYVALASPHTPIMPTAPFRGRSGVNVYGDFCIEVDAFVGDLLDRLDHTGLAGNTIVLFTADNGFAPAGDLPALRAAGHEPSAGFRGHKADLFEGGHRVPYLVRWPKVIPAATSSPHLIGQVDLFATMAEVLGSTVPPNAAEDSVSHLAAWRTGSPPAPRSALVQQSSDGSFAIREGRWKLCLCPGSGGWSFPNPEKHDTRGMPRHQLYDLEADPAETTNLESRHPDVVARLARLLGTFIDRGRSTPGPAQPTVRPEAWPQTAWRADFPPH